MSTFRVRQLKEYQRTYDQSYPWHPSSILIVPGDPRAENRFP